MRIFTVRVFGDELFEVWDVDAQGAKSRFRGRFLNRGTAVLYLNGQLTGP